MPSADPAKRLAQQRAYTARNREHINARHSEWKAANPDAVRAYSRKAYAKNPAKFNAKSKAYAAKHKPWRRESNRIKQREWLYGMPLGTFNELLAAQNGHCAGCTTIISSTTAQVDHCHETKRVRGLLCRTCNLALGHAKDDPNTLRRLAAYLEKETHLWPKI